jgi:hypothetical protein
MARSLGRTAARIFEAVSAAPRSAQGLSSAKLDHREEITLIFDRQESGRNARIDPVGEHQAGCEQRQRSPARADDASDAIGVGVRSESEAGVEGAERRPA